MSFDDDALTLKAIIRAEDKEIESLQISGSNKTSPAITHFNNFLKRHCDSKGYNSRKGVDPITRIEQLPFEGIFLDGDNHDPDRWWSDLIKAFLYYLAHHATDQRYKTKRILIRYEAATGYASAIKSYLTKRQFWGKRFTVFETEWMDLRAELRKQLECRARITGGRITDPKLGSSSEDRRQMANVCFLLGTVDFAEFHAINVLMHHVIGRGREVSVLKPEDMYLVDIPSRTTHQVLGTMLQPDKGNELQELNLYPQKEGIQEDIYFALCYHLLVGSRELPYLFPRFSRAARVVGKNNKTESRIAQVWSQDFRHIEKEGQCLVDSFETSNLTSYHARKGANQQLAETPSVGGLSQIFRAGWSVMSGTHTVLKYVMSSKELTNQSGKALAGWSSEQENNKDVFPPELSSIRLHREKVEPFIEALFSWDTNKQWSVRIRNLLVASLLRHYDDFILIIQQHPKGLYADPSRHALVHVVEVAMNRAGVTQETFVTWCKETRDRFAQDNFMSLPIHLLPPDMAHKVKIDPRSLYDCFNTICHSYNSLYNQKMSLEDDVLRLRVNVEALAHNNLRLTETVETLVDQNAKILKILEIQHNKQTKEPEAPTDVKVSLFSDTMKRWSKDQSLEDCFYNFFKDQCYEGYQYELKTQDFQKKLKSEKNKISTNYKRKKRGIKVLLYFCDRYPKPIPQDPNQLSAWHRDLKFTAKQAVAGLLEALPPPHPKRLTLAFLMKAPITKDWDNPHSASAKDLPKDTPDHIRTHFLG